ncbi:hypothetical protein BJX63DRAFT_430824 [Aspergillus granulosus]|uniref:Uncharacterized protein n=1 Tax=Aspergillus granulosus TaxID=176169 RepID=A0ABR4HIK6_9EURO
MTATTNQEHEDSSNDIGQTKEQIDIPSHQFTTDDCFKCSLTIATQPVSGNGHGPMGQTPNSSNSGENTALRDYAMRLMQTEREDKKKLLAARREESRNAGVRSTTSVNDHSKL